MNTVERARGRWPEILRRLGVETKFLVNKHGACPICRRGTDRYRFDDKRGEGTYFCSQCGPGTGLILVRKLKGWDFKTACDEIDKIIGTDDGDDDRGATKEAAERERRKADTRFINIKRILAEANAPEVVVTYLRRRGLSVIPPVLRGHPRCPYYDDDRRLVGSFPTVIAPILGPDGSLQSVHRIYHADGVTRKKPLPPVGTISGAEVRLIDVSEGVVGLTEGIENAIAVHQMFGIPTWSALSAGGVKSFEPPPDIPIRKLLVYADNDANFTGQDAAFALARRLSVKIQVEVHIPPEAGVDWLDILNKEAVGP